MRAATQDLPPLRPVKLGPADVVIERRDDGAILMRSPHPLPPYPRNLTDRLVHWAQAAPNRVFLAQRNASGEWRTLSYAQTYAQVRAIAAALLTRDLSPERPIAILSGNDIEHALIGLAAMHVGIPYAPISVPYSLLSQDFQKLKTIVDILTPGLVFAANGAAFAQAIAATVPDNVEIAVTASPPPADRRRRCSPVSPRRSRPKPSRSPTPKSAPKPSPRYCSPPARPASRKA